MALKVWEGFDHYNATADFLARSGFLQWQTPTSIHPVISFVAGRNSSALACKVNYSGFHSAGQAPDVSLRAVFGARNVEAYFGQALLIPSGTLGPATSLWLYLQDTVAGTTQLAVYFNGNNYSVQIFRGTSTGTSIALSPNNVWAGDVFNFVEVHAKIDPSSGVLDVRINGVSVFGGPVTGLNTQASANAWFDAADYYPFAVANGATGAFVEIDDFYYADTTTGPGTFPGNTFLGDARVATLFATGNGSVQWTPLTATNWQEIDDVAMDSDASYNHSATAGQEDTFTFTPLGGTITVIYGVQVTIAGRKDDGGSRVIKAATKSGATEVYGANHSLPDNNYAYFSDIWILDPDTSANWTLSGVNGATFGYNLVS